MSGQRRDKYNDVARIAVTTTIPMPEQPVPVRVHDVAPMPYDHEQPEVSVSVSALVDQIAQHTAAVTVHGLGDVGDGRLLALAGDARELARCVAVEFAARGLATPGTPSPAPVRDAAAARAATPPVDAVRSLLQHIAGRCPVTSGTKVFNGGALQWTIDNRLVDIGGDEPKLTAAGERYLIIIGGTP